MYAGINNGLFAKRHSVTLTRKKICEEVLKILWSEGYINGYKINTFSKYKIDVLLKYSQNGVSVLSSLKPISKPGNRIRYSIKQLWKIDTGSNFIIFSTNQGLKTGSDCKKLGIGGEALVLVR